jgi:hypothetical protein
MKIGDKIRCIDTIGSMNLLVLNQVYTVTEMFGICPIISGRTYSPERFVIVWKA